MAESIVVLRRKAKRLGLPVSVYRSPERAVIEAAIKEAKNGSSTPSKKKKAVKKAVAAVETPRKRGRPKGSTNKPKAISGKTNKRTPAESPAKRGKAKRSASASNGDSGRLLVGKLDFVNYDHEEWNPREGSRTEYIFKALKKAKGDVEKTFDALKGEVNDLIEARNRNGEKRSKDERLAMLRYHIHQVRWRFAIQTGQHEKGTSRREYGTGDYAQRNKPARGRPKTKATTEAPKKRGRPPKAKAEAEPTKRRGRPPGSKNKKTKR